MKLNYLSLLLLLHANIYSMDQKKQEHIIQIAAEINTQQSHTLPINLQYPIQVVTSKKTWGELIIQPVITFGGNLSLLSIFLCCIKNKII